MHLQLATSKCMCAAIVTLITIVVVVAAAALNLRNTCWPPQMIDYISMPQPPAFNAATAI